MPLITLSQAETQLALWIEADATVATNQSYTIAGRSLTRADAAEISRKIDFWENRVRRLTNGGGIRIRGGTPV